MRKGLGSGLVLVGCLVLAGCKREEAPPPAAPAPPPRAEAPPTPPPEDDAGRPTPAEETPVADAGAAGPTPPTPAAGNPPEDPRHREWTAGTVTLRRSGFAPVLLRSVRAARNAGFDRVVFEFDGPQVPGYQLEYIDSPVRRCGSGDTTQVAGQGWLQVRLTPAQAHTDAGQPTVTQREQRPALPVLQELELTCDFEAEVTWVLGNAKPQPYRVMELREPTRLVVDVRH